jgi:hypothetical protein
VVASRISLAAASALSVLLQAMITRAPVKNKCICINYSAHSALTHGTTTGELISRTMFEDILSTAKAIDFE